MKKQIAAIRGNSFTPNPPGVMEKNNKLMLEIDKHNRTLGKVVEHQVKQIKK